MRKRYIFIPAVLILIFFNSLLGQEHTENKADQILRGSGRVNPSTLGMEIDIPLGSYPGRGINVPISLSYSSKLWRTDFTGNWPGGVISGGCISVNSVKYSENSASGWTTSLATPYIEYVGKDNIYNSRGFAIGDPCDPNAPPDYSWNAYVRRLTIHLPSGETHELRVDDTPVLYPPSSVCPPANGYSCDPNDPSWQYNWDRTYYAVDGSNIKYIEDSTTSPPTYKLLMPDGSFYDFAATTTWFNQSSARKAVKFTDRNGNFISYNDQTGAWTDTMSRTLTPPIGTSAPTAPTAQTYTIPGMTGNFKFYWKKLKDTTAAESALTDFNQELKYYSDKYHTGTYPYWGTRPAGTFLFGSTEEAYVNTIGIFNPIVLTQIELPNGQSYKFTYDIYGRIERIYYPMGGEERFVYNAVAPLAESLPGNVSDQTNFGVTNRKLYPTAGQSANYEWNYSVTYVAPSGYKVSTTSPDGTINQRILHRGYPPCEGCTQGVFGYDNGLAGMPYEELNFSNTGQLVTRKLTSWTKTSLPVSGGSLPADWHPRINYEEAIVYDSTGNGVSTTTKKEYEGNLNLRETPLLVNKTTQYAFVPITSGNSLAGNNIYPEDPPEPTPTPVPTPTPASLTPVKIIETTYVINDTVTYPDWVRDIYKANNMVGLVRTSTIKDGAETIVSRSEMKYDDGILSPAIGRGNPTTSRTWDSTKGNWDNPNAYIQTSAKFDNYGNQIEATDAKGNTTLTEYSATYNYAFPTKVTSAVPDPNPSQNPDGLAHGSNSTLITTATFDPITGLPLSTTDINGLETRIEYDPVTLRQRFARTFYQNAQVGSVSETVYHDETNNYWVKSRTQIDTDKWVEKITYFDGLGRPYKVEQINSQGNIYVNREFDSDGRESRVSNPYRLSNDICYQNNQIVCWTTNIYDESSRVKEVILPDGAKVKTDYGISISGTIGTTKQITDQAGKKRKGITDALGRMVRVIEDPDGQNLATDYVFDTLGNLRKTIQDEQFRYFTYDSLGRLLYAKQPEQEVNAAFNFTDPITNNSAWSVKYEYDDNGNITKTTNANGVSIQGTYDKFNRLIYRNYSDTTPDVSLFYDGKYLDINDAVQTATGSVNGKMTGVKSSVSRTNSTSFDNLGRLLTHQQITDGQTYSTSYTYSLSGALLTETYPSNRVVSYESNADGNLSRVAGQTATGVKTYANAFNYNSLGAVEKLRLGNGKWETTVYNNRQQITQMSLGNGSADTSLLKLSFDYGTNLQNNGSMRSQVIQVPNVGSNPGFTATQIYTYDDLNRLQSATENISGQTDPSWKQTFSYDRFGNRRFDAANTTTLSQSAPTKVINPQINTSDNRLKKDQDNDNITDYDFDKVGNLTLDAENRRLVYDAENRMTAFFLGTNITSTPDATYLYDGEGKRVKKVSSTETTVFIYDAEGKLVSEYSTQLPLSPTTNYLTQDHLGSPRIITNVVGEVIARKDFSAFGEETFTAQRTANLGYKPENIRQDYTGYQKDEESELEYAQARYYNSLLGRFNSVDPLTASVSIRNPQTFNRYSYVLNSPYKFSDPLGLLPEGRSSQTGCGAEYSSCSDYDPSEEWGSIPESHSNEADAAPATQETSSDDAASAGQPVADDATSPPAPSADQNAESDASTIVTTQAGGGYDVHGSNYRQARENAENPAINRTPNGTPGYTHVQYSSPYSWTIVSQKKVKGGWQVTVKVTKVDTVTVRSVSISLPNWVEYSSENTSQADRDAWDVWLTSLRNHENAHETIGRAYLPTLQAALRKDIGTTATGFGTDLNSAIKAATSNIVLRNYNRAVADQQNRQNELDRVTRGGRDPVPQNFRLGPP